ncbi:uncharacterized protein [Choristoneura fumiferana]|uniref:uncharacterized protein n=1 Tax=Choristoneura fumiferana TaxID=7141 RepID=UPI003D15B18A
MKLMLIMTILLKLVFSEVTILDKAMKTVNYCIHMNNETLSSNQLSGTWYSVYKFALTLNLVDTSECPMNIFTKPTKEELDEYKTKYDIKNETFSFDDYPLLVWDGRLKGIVVGNTKAKYYFLEPKSTMRLSGMYEVMVFRPISDEYLIFYECSLRGHVKWLWSRRNNQTDEEIVNVVKGIKEVANKETQRFCAKLKEEEEYF